MQVFSKLSGNSFIKISIKLLIIYFINLFSSFTMFAPLLLGVFLVCEEIIFSFLFVLIFIFFHKFNLVWFLLFFIFVKFVLIEKVKNMISLSFQDISLFFITYLFVLIYLLIFSNLSFNLILIYSLYNFTADILIFRLFKCNINSYRF
jgi:hypothetical protein